VRLRWRESVANETGPGNGRPTEEN
jgi:hypothetical protein